MRAGADAREETGGNRVRGNRKPQVSQSLVKAWRDALAVTPQDVAAFIPTERELTVAESLLDGQLNMTAIVAASDLTEAQVREVFRNPVAMAWISRQIDQLCQHRLGLVDASMFTRAINGDVTAAKLVYERAGKLQKAGQVNVIAHGNTQINLGGLSNDELKRLIDEEERALALKTDAAPGAGATVPRPEGAVGEAEDGTAAVLHPAPPAGGVPQHGDEQAAPADAGGEPVGEEPRRGKRGPGARSRLLVLESTEPGADGGGAHASSGLDRPEVLGEEDRRDSGEGPEHGDGDLGATEEAGDR